MIVTKQWLNEWIDINTIDTDKIAIALNSIGLEVDGVHQVRIPANVVVGKVISCEKHPNADKLNVCQVDVGTGTEQQIVCGAKNVAAGQMVAVALIGAVLPGGIKIKEAKLRDIQSCGMLCSSTELGLPKINDGIMLLDESIGTLVIGKSLSEYPLINDDIIEIGLTPNRGDCQSIYGVARDLSVYFDLEVKVLNQKEDEENQPGIGRVLNVSGSEALDGSYMYKVFDNKEIQVPLLVELRLGFAQVESKGLLESLINYAIYVSGVLIRAYNHECFGEKNEKAKIVLSKDENGLDTVFAQSKKVALCGIAQDEDCKASATDERIIVEANYTHPDIISTKSANKKLNADKHLYRSSRGSEPHLAFGLNYFFKMLAKKSTIMLYADAQQITQVYEEKTINIHQADLTEMIGEEIPKNRIIKILKKLGFGVNFAFEQDVINIKIPQFRHDVVNMQDICEEIVRVVGIDNITSKPFIFAEKLKINQPYIDFKKRQMYRHKAVAVGFFETLHFVFDDAKDLQKFHLPVIEDALNVANPITSELNTLRTSLIPNILRAVSQNLKFGKKRVPLFEVGSVFDASRCESKKIAFAFSGEDGIAEVSNHGKPEDINFFTFAKKIQSVVGSFELLPYKEINGLCSPYEVARIIISGVEIGYMARVNMQIEKDLDLSRTYICEIDFNALPFERKIAKDYSKFPSTSRDLSLMVPSHMEYITLEQFIRSIAPKELIKFSPIDRYEHESFGENVSLTLKLQFQSTERTLEEEDIAKMLDMILQKIKEQFGITIR